MTMLTLRRMEQTDFATYGHLLDAEDKALGVTLERPWLNNARGVSCIPAGVYPAMRYRSPKRGYDVFVLSGVPDRDDIEIHIGNTVGETEGCILIGSNFGTVNGQRGITGSSAAFVRFMDAMRSINDFTLTVLGP